MLPQELLTLPLLTSTLTPNYTTSPAGNPFIPGWYADPDAKFFAGSYWVYPTSSLPYEEQTYLDAFSSPDLVHWTRHPSILTTSSIPWARRALWAPCVVHKNDKYYLYFAANDIQEDEDPATVIGGIGVAVSDSPGGPFIDALGKPLIGEYHHGAQPIDQDVFVDEATGDAYIYYGGHGHAVMARLKEDMVSIGNITYPDGTSERFREITPENYVEGPVVFKRKEKYYMMWSEGGWGGPDYAVAYGMADTPLGPFRRKAKVLQQDDAVATGSGHNGVVNVPGTDIWYIVYHRRPLSERDQNHRVVCYDQLVFDETGNIKPVKMLVRDDFSDGKLIGWRQYPATFEVMDGEMRNVVDTALEEVWGTALLDTNFGDQVYEADVTVLEGHDARLVFRATKGGDDPADAMFEGYYAGLSARQKTVTLCKEWIGGYVMNRTDLNIQVGRKYHVKVTAVGNRFEVFVDDMDVPVITATDVSEMRMENSMESVFRRGKNGVMVSQVVAAFDNMAIDRFNG